MRQGVKLFCKKTIKDNCNKIIFKKNVIYPVNYVDNETTKTLVSINHDDLSIRMKDFDLEWVYSNFKIL